VNGHSKARYSDARDASIEAQLDDDSNLKFWNRAL
jgi:hypothetical protein